MRRKDLDYAVIAAMFLSGLYVALSGVVTDVFGLHQFVLHRYAGYACATCVLLHLALNWPRVTAYLRRRFRRQERPAPLPKERTPLLGRRGFLASGLAAVAGFVLGRLVPSQGLVGPPSETADIGADVGALYHEWSKLGSLTQQVLGVVVDWGERPEQYKSYADTGRIELPNPQGYQGLSLEEAVETRRSIREYSGESLSLEELSRLLYAAQGVTRRAGMLRAAPSAGALYPIELYAVVHDVTGLEAGIYHYDVRTHELELLRQRDLRGAVMRAALGQDFLAVANVCFVLSAICQRTRWRYRERAYRYVLLEAGHIGQNLYLAASSMGLGACAVGAFHDDDVNDLLKLDGEEEMALYIISVGKV